MGWVILLSGKSSICPTRVSKTRFRSRWRLVARDSLRGLAVHAVAGFLGQKFQRRPFVVPTTFLIDELGELQKRTWPVRIEPWNVDALDHGDGRALPQGNHQLGASRAALAGQRIDQAMRVRVDRQRREARSRRELKLDAGEGRCVEDREPAEIGCMFGAGPVELPEHCERGGVCALQVPVERRLAEHAVLEALIAATVEAIGCEPANVAQFVERLDPPADPMLAEKAEQIQAGHILASCTNLATAIEPIVCAGFVRPHLCPSSLTLRNHSTAISASRTA